MGRLLFAAIAIVAALSAGAIAQPPSTPLTITREAPRTSLAPIVQAQWRLTETPKIKPVILDSAIAPGGPSQSLTATGPIRRMLRRLANGTFWNWARPARHHAAAVSVSCTQYAQAGSGWILRTTSTRYVFVVTNAHVVRHEIDGAPDRRIDVTWQDGRKRVATYAGATGAVGSGPDLAIYAILGNPAEFAALPIAASTPPAGIPAEVLGFGGPGFGTFRPYRAALLDSTEPVAVDAPSISGDSGSAIVVASAGGAAVIGVNYGTDHPHTTDAGYSTREGVKSIGLHWPASSAATPAIMHAWLTQQCSPFGCQPVVEQWQQSPQPSGQLAQGQYPGIEQFYPPPGQSYPQTPPAYPQTAPVTTPAPGQYPIANTPTVGATPIALVDSDKLAEILASDPRFKGPTGGTGPAGPIGPAGNTGAAGPAGRDGTDAVVTSAQLESVVAAVVAQIKSDPALQSALQGPRGPSGEAAEIDIDQITSAVRENLPAISLALVDPDGRELDRDTAQLGGTLRLELFEQK